QVATAASHAGVDGRGLPAVALTLPVGEAVGIGLDDRDAAIAGTTVHDDDLETRITLAEDALQRLGQELHLVVRGHDDADQGQRGGSHAILSPVAAGGSPAASTEGPAARRSLRPGGEGRGYR